MYTQGHCFNIEMGEAPTLDVRFVFPVDPYETEELAELLKQVELFLGAEGGINFVSSSETIRCFYCGTKSKDDDKSCSQCGAPL